MEMTGDQSNTSGMGSTAAVPPEIRGWNWGAFWLSWIWAIAHSTWIGLLSLVPYVGVIMHFVLGAKGSEWAWQNRRFEGGVAEFKAVQRAWAKWAAVLVIVAVTMILLAILFRPL